MNLHRYHLKNTAPTTNKGGSTTIIITALMKFLHSIRTMKEIGYRWHRPKIRKKEKTIQKI